VIPPGTSIGTVRLRVADIDALSEFYERVIGLRSVERDGDLARLGPEGGRPLVELVGAPRAAPAPGFSTGLFHLAILVPDRPELARALKRVIEHGWRLTGASDHLVSEALYLSDPEGNGIEIYRDRPRDQWGHSDTGELRMATLPLDLDGVMGELTGDGESSDGMPAATTMGHVHLQVAGIPAAEAFYNGAIGLDVMVRSYPGALFLSAGGYHHHLGLNTWQSEGAPPPPEGALGLDRYELVLPDEAERDAAAERVAATGDPVRLEEGVLATDPSGNRVLLTT
jgi:catechol 2,3-dioxygenase